jgi:hypothetical protein
MSDQFTTADIMLIEKEMGRKTYTDIAFLLDKEVVDVTTFINALAAERQLITYQQSIDAKRSAVKKVIVKQPKPIKKAEVKEKEKVMKARNLQEVYKRERDKKEQRRMFKTKKVDYSQMITVRVDSKTVVYTKPGDDPEQVRKKYLDNLAARQKNVPTSRFQELKSRQCKTSN